MLGAIEPYNNYRWYVMLVTKAALVVQIRYADMKLLLLSVVEYADKVTYYKYTNSLHPHTHTYMCTHTLHSTHTDILDMLQIPHIIAWLSDARPNPPLGPKTRPTYLPT